MSKEKLFSYDDEPFEPLNDESKNPTLIGALRERRDYLQFEMTAVKNELRQVHKDYINAIKVALKDK